MPEDTRVAVKSPARRAPTGFTETLIEPLSRLRSELDRLFAEFPGRWPRFDFAAFAPNLPMPAIDMKETDKAFKLSVEVPGMEPSEIDVSVHDDMLVISGEKKEEREEKDEGYLYSERSFGSFERRIQLPIGADPDKIKAQVRKGVLQVTLPKNEKAAKSKRRIAVDAA